MFDPAGIAVSTLGCPSKGPRPVTLLQLDATGRHVLWGAYTGIYQGFMSLATTGPHHQLLIAGGTTKTAPFVDEVQLWNGRSHTISVATTARSNKSTAPSRQENGDRKPWNRKSPTPTLRAVELGNPQSRPVSDRRPVRVSVTDLSPTGAAGHLRRPPSHVYRRPERSYSLMPPRSGCAHAG